MIVIDLDMINITKTPHVHITHLALIIFRPHFVVFQPIFLAHIAEHKNLTLVLANAPLAITISLLDAINHHTALLVNHVPIAIEADLLREELIKFPKKINYQSYSTTSFQLSSLFHNRT